MRLVNIYSAGLSMFAAVFAALGLYIALDEQSYGTALIDLVLIIVNLGFAKWNLQIFLQQIQSDGPGSKCNY